MPLYKYSLLIKLYFAYFFKYIVILIWSNFVQFNFGHVKNEKFDFCILYYDPTNIRCFTYIHIIFDLDMCYYFYWMFTEPQALNSCKFTDEIKTSHNDTCTWKLNDLLSFLQSTQERLSKYIENVLQHRSKPNRNRSFGFQRKIK